VDLANLNGIAAILAGSSPARGVGAVGIEESDGHTV
jgi:hypothetical protein